MLLLSQSLRSKGNAATLPTLSLESFLKYVENPVQPLGDYWHTSVAAENLYQQVRVLKP